jgi:transcriptional regulator with XRE-family HTH domain
MDIEKIEQYVIDYVKALRIKKGLSQEDIAQILGKSKSFVGNIESPKNRAKYNLVHINALADYFQISPKDFLPELPFLDD